MDSYGVHGANCVNPPQTDGVPRDVSTREWSRLLGLLGLGQGAGMHLSQRRRALTGGAPRGRGQRAPRRPGPAGATQSATLSSSARWGTWYLSARRAQPGTHVVRDLVSRMLPRRAIAPRAPAAASTPRSESAPPRRAPQSPQPPPSARRPRRPRHGQPGRRSRAPPAGAATR